MNQCENGHERGYFPVTVFTIVKTRCFVNLRIANTLYTVSRIFLKLAQVMGLGRIILCQFYWSFVPCLYYYNKILCHKFTFRRIVQMIRQLMYVQQVANKRFYLRTLFIVSIFCILKSCFTNSPFSSNIFSKIKPCLTNFSLCIKEIIYYYKNFVINIPTFKHQGLVDSL